MVKDLPEAIIEADIQLGSAPVMRDSKGKKMSPKQIAAELHRATVNEPQIQMQTEEEFKDKNPILNHGICEIDGRPIVVMAFKGTGVCCELCRKVKDEKLSREEADNQRKSLRHRAKNRILPG